MPSIIIIGSGPAGISAALYAVRAGVDTTVLTKGPGALDRAEKLKLLRLCRAGLRCGTGTPQHRECKAPWCEIRHSRSRGPDLYG